MSLFIIETLVAFAGMSDDSTSNGDRLVTTTEGCCRSGGNGDDMAAVDVVDNKVSIDEILEGMTNEFNKGVSPTKHADNEKITGVEEVKSPSAPSDIINEVSKGEKDHDCSNTEVDAQSKDEEVAPSVPEENHKEEEENFTGKQDGVKKDNGIPRIVLTFRTIDENTDDGRKTKISSCSSNLTLVPDELANCDQIGGVSVKIENSDENFDTVEESQVEGIKKEESIKVVEPKNVNENKSEISTGKLEDVQSTIQENCETAKSNTDNNMAVETISVEAKQEDKQETTTPVTRKRRGCRARLRAFRFFHFFLFNICQISKHDNT